VTPVTLVLDKDDWIVAICPDGEFVTIGSVSPNNSARQIVKELLEFPGQALVMARVAESLSDALLRVSKYLETSPDTAGALELCEDIGRTITGVYGDMKKAGLLEPR
jgi:hypothetical protein